MKSNFLLSFLRACKLPFKLLGGWLKSKRKGEKSELEKKQLTYVRNFSPRHYSWQQSLGKNKKTFKKKKLHLRNKNKENSTKK